MTGKGRGRHGTQDGGVLRLAPGLEMKSDDRARSFKTTVEETERPFGQASLKGDETGEPRKLVIRGGVQVQVLHETVQELDAHGRQLRTVEFTSSAAEQVRSRVRRQSKDQPPPPPPSR